MLAPLAEEIKPIISSLALRSMQKAKYSPECVGHFGLGSQFYCHFTAPIRRYPDLVIHRIIKLMLNRKLSSHKLEELTEYVRVASEQSSKTEVAATEAEREVDNLKRAEYMRDHIGEQFSGHISGIADFGVFVYLPNTVEGLIKIENMPNDTYKFNEQQSTLIGRRRTWKMGDKIDVIVASVNMPRRQVEFSAVK
jgi:ribonuclease R